MSNPNNRPEHQLSPHEAAWQPLVLAAEAGMPLSPEDTKALQTREACLKIAGYVDVVGEGEMDTDDPVAHASALAQYYHGYSDLEQLGVVANAQTERPEEDYEQPAIVAEYMGGQWMDALGKPIQQAKHVARQLEEFSELKAENEQ